MTLKNPPAGYPVMSGIILTTLITAIVHLSFGIPLFVLNGVGYLGLLVLLYAPLATLERFRPVVRYVLIGYTVLTIVLYFVMAPLMAVGLLTKAVEAVLVALLVVEASQARRTTP
ncbi:hypothetical protein [Brachybacterium saurashtrense]|uniref:Uncharacterized protein n=1 Tax=Brachybacterium saurashtrense TaxID=556288 RepID=A0A345YR65_9MICO|nr:hypothetical protein [Brachybacterium saurashtrense]AXK46417.1 hypothetical protein DWV08_12880 [Brachybacterium saurashtrense]RRR24158.1 hypothetical protein DXU92_04630 [Brachybacterium saurashtrense]